jgi:hypothetical protein
MNNLNLEVSLKPFYGLGGAALTDCCRRLLAQWAALIQRADTVSVMYWAADGSEILDYAGDLDAEMEWARFIGNANAHVHPHIPSDPEGKSTHARSYLYREDALPITYRRFAEIIAAWREALGELGKPGRIGLTFDPGGEFAPSSFKYQRHREICLADTMGKASFVCCYGILDEDKHAYAGFPKGIPQGTSVGTFLGRQFQCLATDLGLDFLWFSNGFGFGMETWMTIGPLFNGTTFFPERAAETRDRILGFWRDFRRECPELGIMTRGTNLGTGTDLSSDATPLRELYEGGFEFDPPPNSPWAALNGDFGLEMAGYMSRIVELPPGRAALFRFYIHDPWWLNSPWLDRYERQPHDIFLPLSVARVNAAGHVEPPGSLSLLTIDDSYGLSPDIVPLEVQPLLTRAWEERPDAPGPLVWLYPFDEMHDAMFGARPAPERLFHTDWFIREALNAGAPLNTVVSTRSWAALGERVREVFAGRIVVTPAPFGPEGEDALLAWVEGGGTLIVYGPLDRAPRLRERLGLESAGALEGQFTVQSRLAAPDAAALAGGTAYFHQAAVSAGGLGEIAAPCATPDVIARSEQESVRALAARWKCPGSGGVLEWLRGPLPMRLVRGEHLPQRDDPATTFPLPALLRRVLERHGWEIGFGAENGAQRTPVLALHRHANGWFFSGFMPDTTVELRLRTPFGTPVLLGQETWTRGGASTYRMQRGWRHECRVFVEQGEDGWLRCTEDFPAQVGVTRRCWVRGLRDATLRFFPPTGAGPVTLYLDPAWPQITGETVPLREVHTPHGLMLETTAPVSGAVLLSW